MGIKRKGDINARIFTPTDFCALENPVLDGDGAQGAKGAVILSLDGKHKPNLEANKSTPFDNEKYIDIS